MGEGNVDEVIRLAAFADGERGGNPAGVLVGDTLPSDERMRAIAAEVGYSETAFACPAGETEWRVRYFSPESEVPFCGHATIALGAALAAREGEGRFLLRLNRAVISVEGRHGEEGANASLQSPPTRSEPADPALLARVLALFGYVADDLDPSLPPRRASAGAEHLIVALRTRAALAAMDYDLDRGRALMREAGLVTVAFAHERDDGFDVRNAFASGGVFEDPATGAAAAALAGMLRDLGRPAEGTLELVQGEDMGMRSRLYVEYGPEPGASVRVSGSVRTIQHSET